MRAAGVKGNLWFENAVGHYSKSKGMQKVKQRRQKDVFFAFNQHLSSTPIKISFNAWRAARHQVSLTEKVKKLF